MDWNEMQRQWRAAPASPAPIEPLGDIEARDRKLRATLKRRDRVETWVAVAMAPVFVAMAIFLYARSEWLGLGFCTMILAWLAFVPLRLWHARRQLPAVHHDLPLVAYLHEERAAMLAQARMLEQAWLWYFAPAAIAIPGLAFAIGGVTAKTTIYAAIVVAGCIALAFVNRYAARTVFRDHADAIERQLAALTEESPT